MVGTIGNLICSGIVIFGLLGFGVWQFVLLAEFFVNVWKYPAVNHKFPVLSFLIILFFCWAVGSVFFVMVLDTVLQ